MDKKATIYDIAIDSGVSPATVSRVLNQPEIVSENTKLRVLSSIKKLNFTYKEVPPIEKNSQGFIIISLCTLGNPFYEEIVRGVTAAAARYGCTVLLFNDPITLETIPKIKSISKKLKAIGLITFNLSDKTILTVLNDILPVVQCCECDASLEISSVTVNDVSAAFSAVEYLISLGRKKICMINGPLNTKYGRDRLEGYQLALKKYDIPYISSLVTNLPDVNYNIAVSAVTQMLSPGNAVTPNAIFTSSDVYAIAAIRAAYLCGKQIPSDLMIIGFDNIDLSALCTPTLTTVNQPREQMGFVACELLMERINHPDSPIKHMVLDTEMILRESTSFNFNAAAHL